MKKTILILVASLILSGCTGTLRKKQNFIMDTVQYSVNAQDKEGNPVKVKMSLKELYGYRDRIEMKK